jgi:hypothetical protein
MKRTKKLSGASILGVKVKLRKALDSFSGTVLFPEKLKNANKVVGKLKMG